MNKKNGNELVTFQFYQEEKGYNSIIDISGESFLISNKDFLEMIRHFSFDICPKSKHIHLKNPKIKSNQAIDKEKHKFIKENLNEYRFAGREGYIDFKETSFKEYIDNKKQAREQDGLNSLTESDFLI